MLLRPDERTVVMIDGANNAAASKAVATVSNDQLDMSLLIKHLKANTTLVHAVYYTAVMDAGQPDPLANLITYLKNNGYTMRLKGARRYGEGVASRIKGNMDVEIACDMLTFAANRVDHIILFSGDNDFAYAVNRVQLYGCRVTVVSTRATTPKLLGDTLLDAADDFVELRDLATMFRRA